MAWTWRNILETGWLRRVGIAASVLAHVAVLAWIVFGSSVKLYDPSRPDVINVELVPLPEAAKKAGDLTLPTLDASKPEDSKVDQPTPDEPKPPQPAKAEKTPDKPDPTTATEAPIPPTTPAPMETATYGQPVVQPDVMDQYGKLFESLGGGEANKETADLKSEVVAAFRNHLKECLKLPAGVSPADDARIVLRVALKKDGTLAAPPALMEAKASPKGPLIMQAATKALEACQPYSMLPADKYKEWRELDLEFTPAGFG